MDQFSLFPFFSLYPYTSQQYQLWRLQNPSSFVQIGFNFYQYPDQYYNLFPTSEVEVNPCGVNDGSKNPLRLDSRQIYQKNNLQLNDHLKLQECFEQAQKTRKLKNNDFTYYDPGQAPYLTFGIEDIEVNQKKWLRQFKTQNSQNIDNQLSDHQENQIPQPVYTQKHVQFIVTQPDPYRSPFLIIKAKISKRRLLSLQQYQRRAEQIEKRRLKNLHRLQIEQRIGKKLPTKNKKWQRKKQSLVFNANEYKKKLMSSKKFKTSQDKYKELFTGLS